MNHRQVAHFPCSLCLFPLKPSFNKLLNPVYEKNREVLLWITDLLPIAVVQCFQIPVSNYVICRVKALQLQQSACILMQMDTLE